MILELIDKLIFFHTTVNKTIFVKQKQSRICNNEQETTGLLELNPVFGILYQVLHIILKNAIYLCNTGQFQLK